MHIYPSQMMPSWSNQLLSNGNRRGMGGGGDREMEEQWEGGGGSV